MKLTPEIRQARPFETCNVAQAWRSQLFLLVLTAGSVLLFACGGGQESGKSTAAAPDSKTTNPVAEARPGQNPLPDRPEPIEVAEEPAFVRNYRYEVLNVFTHDQFAYTQGLQVIDGELFESTGQWGQSSLRRVKLESGEVLQQHNLAGRYFGEGLSVVGQRIYQLTWRSGLCFVYDRKSFAPIDTLRYNGEGWGLTFDGTDLIMSNGSARLEFRDPEDFSVRRSIEVHDGATALNNLNELEYINGEIWANVYTTDMIARIDPAKGRVTGLIKMHGILAPSADPTGRAEVLNGIAWDADNERLFVTGKNWPKLFEIELIAD